METKVKTTFTISADLLEKIENAAKEENRKRSDLVEKGMRDYLAKLRHEKRNEQDIKLINENVEELNKEAMDVLDYQFDW